MAQLTDDDEALKDEEEEAQRLQREAAEQLQPEDFEQEQEEDASSSSDEETETMGAKARQVQALEHFRNNPGYFYAHLYTVSNTSVYFLGFGWCEALLIFLTAACFPLCATTFTSGLLLGRSHTHASGMLALFLSSPSCLVTPLMLWCCSSAHADRHVPTTHQVYLCKPL